MEERFERTKLVLGEAAISALLLRRVAVFGLGGVGCYAVEALARAGVGELGLVDCDVYTPSNLNRQLFATQSTLGRKKTEAARERVLDVFPQCRVEIYDMKFLPDTEFDFGKYDYIVDAMDMVSAKLAIIGRARAAGVPVISCMGTGNKKDPTMLEVGPIEKTSVCPLARVMRRELKARGIRGVKVVFSREEPAKGMGRTPGSTPFVPAAAGLILAAEVVKDLTQTE